jgi:exodeoxyribonuclease VII large subunit
MHGRHVSELESVLQHAMRGGLAERERRYRTLRLQLEAFDPRRRLNATRTRLVSDEGRLEVAIRRTRHALDARLRGLAARLDALSPLAVLGRGYAVCWNADRTKIIRDAASVAAGSDVQVTLERGTLTCEVRASST